MSAERPSQPFKISGQCRIAGQQSPCATTGMNDGRMVFAAEEPGDVSGRAATELAGQKHGNLSGQDRPFLPGRRSELSQRNVERFGDCLRDLGQRLTIRLSNF